MTPPENVEDEITQADEVRERVFLALFRLDVALTPPRPAAIPRAVEAPRREEPTTETAGDWQPTDGDRRRGSAKVKLPKISLPRFGGDPVKWTSFWDAYQSAVHGNPDLSQVDKFNYLRSLLDHTALDIDAVAGLTLSEANYRHAIEILQRRFGNKQLIISKHMDTLMNMETITSDRNLKDLRRLYDHTESHVRSLRSLGIEAESYGALLSPVLLAKLPPDLRLIVSRKVSESSLDMEALLTTFEEELLARERANLPSHRNEKQRIPNLFTNSKGGQRTDPQCCYCQQSHPSSTCSSVTTLTDRKQSLKANGRCFNCLRRGHVTRTCKSSSRCQKCKKKHHTSICDDDQAQGLNQTPPGGATPLNPTATSFQASQTTSTLCSGSHQSIFLQTARAVVHRPSESNVSLEVRLVLDGGSQRSYVSQHVCDVLDLPVVGEQALSIATFSASEGSTKVCPIVSVGMCMRGYPSMLLSLYEVPTICEPLVGQPIAACVEQYPHLTGLELADSSSGGPSMSVDILIGSDYYWHLVTGDICRGVSGPVAVHTKLGWVLSGPTSQNTSDPKLSVTNLSVHVLHAESQPVEPSKLDDQLRAF